MWKTPSPLEMNTQRSDDCFSNLNLYINVFHYLIRLFYKFNSPFFHFSYCKKDTLVYKSIVLFSVQHFKIFTLCYHTDHQTQVVAHQSIFVWHVHHFCHRMMMIHFYLLNLTRRFLWNLALNLCKLFWEAPKNQLNLYFI